MAITTLDGVIAGARPPQAIYKSGIAMSAVGQAHSHFYSAGAPGPAAAPTPGMAGAALTTYAGQIPFVNPASGNSYLSRFEAAATQLCTIMLCDRLWHNSGIAAATITAQTINSVAWPARDRDGTTAGEDVLIAVETSAVGGAGTPNLTMAYTNAAGLGSRTAPALVARTTPPVGTFEIMNLQAGDTGVRSIQTFTQSATRTSGTFHLVAFRILAMLNLPVANLGQAVDALSSGFPRLYNDTVPFIVQIPSAATATNLIGHLIYSQG